MDLNYHAVQVMCYKHLLGPLSGTAPASRAAYVHYN